MIPPVQILSPPAAPPRLSAAGRFFALGLAAACLAVLATAAWLRPSPNGLGTHTELRMEPCQFERRTGLPCITCGMTTSFAHFVRGNWLASLYVQPFAALLAMAAAMTLWGSAYIALTGRPAHRLLRLLRARYYLTALFTLAILAWAWKIFIHVRGIDGWRL